jgi:hypothetical protein
MSPTAKLLHDLLHTCCAAILDQAHWRLVTTEGAGWVLFEVIADAYVTWLVGVGGTTVLALQTMLQAAGHQLDCRVHLEMYGPRDERRVYGDGDGGAPGAPGGRL